MSLLTDLTEVVSDAFQEAGLDRAYGEVVVSQRPDLGQFQCNGPLQAAKGAGRAPRALALEVAETLGNNHRFSKIEVAGPGFLNLSITDDCLAEHTQVQATDDGANVPQIEARTIVLDYGGPNVAKELHVGHMRPALIGESLKRIMRFGGHQVTGDVHMGDWGTQMGQLITELERRRPDLPYFDPASTGPYPEESPVMIDDLQEMYPVASARAEADPAEAERSRQATFDLQDGRPGYRALWKHFRRVSVEALKQTYDRLGVEFDLWYGESTVHDRIPGVLSRLEAGGYLETSDGAQIIDVGLPGDKKEFPPLIMVKSDGGYTYDTTDLATIDQRVAELAAQEIIYVVDDRQRLHFEQVFRAAYQTGIAPENVHLEHAPNGTVNGVDGKPFRTRDGDLLRLRGLIDQVVGRAAARLDENELAVGYPQAERAEIAEKVGLAALKFGELQNNRSSNYVFDVERFTSFDGKTGPYLLYGAVRMASVLRRAAEEGVEAGPIVGPVYESERSLMLRLAQLPEVVARTIELRTPNHLAEFAYDLTTDFSRFYEECHILTESDSARQASWLRLVESTRRTLVLALELLVIEVPERM